MAVKGFYACEDLAVVSARDQDLCARADSGLEDRERSGGELMLFDLGDFVFPRRQCQPPCNMKRHTRTHTLVQSVAWKEAPCEVLVQEACHGAWATLRTESSRQPSCRVGWGIGGRSEKKQAPYLIAVNIWGAELLPLNFDTQARASSAQG